MRTSTRCGVRGGIPDNQSLQAFRPKISLVLEGAFGFLEAILGVNRYQEVCHYLPF